MTEFANRFLISRISIPHIEGYSYFDKTCNKPYNCIFDKNNKKPLTSNSMGVLQFQIIAATLKFHDWQYFN